MSSGVVVRSEVVGDGVEVTKRFRLYDAIPPGERLTREVIEAANRSEILKREELEKFDNARCIVGLKSTKYPGLWSRCPRPVHAAADRCLLHGGPSASRSTSEVENLRIENAKLQARLARLESEGPTDER